MAVMALIGFLFAWYTTEWRRKRDRLSQSTEPSAAAATATTPAQFPGLGYLPPDTDIVAGFEVGQLVSDAHGKDLFDTLLAAFSLRQTDLESWTGIKVDDLDYVLFGVKIQDRVLPRMTLVVETRRDYDQAKLKSALKVGRRSERDGRTLFRFRPSDASLEATVWFAGERTLVFGLIPEDFADVPITPSAPGHALAPALTGSLQPMADTTRLWLVGEARNWGRLLTGLSGEPLPLPALNLGEETRQLITKARQFAFWATVDDSVKVRFAIRVEDAKAARRIERLIRDKETELQGNAEKSARSTVHLEIEAKEEWLKGSARMSTDALREVLAGWTTQ
jgi:hypothetical protein